MATEFQSRSQAANGLIMLWTLIVILLLILALGLEFGVAGNLVHILLVVSVVVILFNVLQGRHATRRYPTQAR